MGAGALARQRDREHPPLTPLEWVGVAVGDLPELTARARTADSVHVHSRTQSVDLRTPLLEALVRALGDAAAIAEAARTSLVARYPDSAGDDDPEGYADLLEAAHATTPKHAEVMIGAYASFVGAAIEAAACLSEAELGVARARRWERDDHERDAAVRAGQVHSALSNALGGLLAYARLVALDLDQLSS